MSDEELDICMPTLMNTSSLPFAGISQPFLTSFGRIVDNTIVLLQFYEIALSSRCWRQQQVSSSLHAFCPILLRRITPHYPWIDYRTPLGALAAYPSPWLSPLTHAEIALDPLMQAFHCSRPSLALYLELAGDSGLSEQLAATARSMVCCFWRYDDAFSTGAFGQVCIAIRRVLLGRLSQGQDRCPSLQFHTGGRGVRLPPGLPFGAQLLRALRGL